MNKIESIYLRLSKLQRIAIVLSVLWALGAGIHSHNDTTKQANSSADFAYGVCKDEKLVDHDTNLSSCDVEREKSFKLGMEGEPANSLFVALAPLPFYWMAGFVLLYIYRIFRIGYRVVVQWPSLGKRKKAFVVFTYFFSGVVILFAVMDYLNLVTDRRVPVTLGLGVEIYRDNDNNYANIEGTWTRSGRDEGSAIAYPLNKSKITCRRETAHCEEAKAYVSDNLMMVDTNEYDIIRWTRDQLVFENVSQCYIEV